MALRFEMEYWKDGLWFVGRFPQVPGVFSQGASLGQLEANLQDAYRMIRRNEGNRSRRMKRDTLCKLIERQLGIGGTS